MRAERETRARVTGCTRRTTERDRVVRRLAALQGAAHARRDLRRRLVLGRARLGAPRDGALALAVERLQRALGRAPARARRARSRGRHAGGASSTSAAAPGASRAGSPSTRARVRSSASTSRRRPSRRRATNRARSSRPGSCASSRATSWRGSTRSGPGAFDDAIVLGCLSVACRDRGVARARDVATSRGSSARAAACSCSSQSTDRRCCAACSTSGSRTGSPRANRAGLALVARRPHGLRPRAPRLQRARLPARARRPRVPRGRAAARRRALALRRSRTTSSCSSRADARAHRDRSLTFALLFVAAAIGGAHQLGGRRAAASSRFPRSSSPGCRPSPRTRRTRSRSGPAASRAPSPTGASCATLGASCSRSARRASSGGLAGCASPPPHARTDVRAAHPLAPALRDRRSSPSAGVVTRRRQRRRPRARSGSASLAQLVDQHVRRLLRRRDGHHDAGGPVLLGMTDIHRMNAMKTVLGALINGVAVVAFVLAGAVPWPPALVMIAGRHARRIRGRGGRPTGRAEARAPARARRSVGNDGVLLSADLRVTRLPVRRPAGDAVCRDLFMNR